MAWSAPKTWSSGYVVLAADMNNIRDQLNATAPATLTAQGDIVIASGANALARLAKSTTSTQYLANTGTSNAPAWNEVALDTGISGTLPVGNGGTGQTSLTTGAILIGNSTSAVTMVTQTTKGQILIGDGSGPPQMLGVGSNDQVLTADSGETTGVKWAAVTDLVANIADFVEGNANKVLLMVPSGFETQITTVNTRIGFGFELESNPSGTGFNVSTKLGGGWRIVTPPDSGDYGGFQTSFNLNTNQDWTIVCRLIAQTGGDGQMFLGMQDAVGYGNGNGVIGFRRAGDNNFFGVVDDGGTETTRDTGVNQSGDTEHRFKIVVSGGGAKVQFYMNDSQVGSDVTTNIPSSSTMALGLMFGAISGAGSADGSDFFAWREA